MAEKFEATDFNNDSHLNMEEFAAFQFPRFNDKTCDIWRKEIFATLGEIEV